MKRLFSCISIGLFLLPLSVFALTQAQINSLQSEEAQLEQENTQLSAQKATLESQNQSIQRDINLLDVEIKQEQLQIQEKNIQLQQIGQDITTKSSTISDLEGQLSENQATLAALLRKANEQSAVSLVELVAGSKPLSDVFAEADAEAVLKQNISDVMDSTKIWLPPPRRRKRTWKNNKTKQRTPNKQSRTNRTLFRVTKTKKRSF